MALRDLDIEIDLDVDVSDLLQASAQIDVLIAQLNALDTDININVNADLVRVQQQLAELQRRLNDLDREDIDIDVNTRATEALSELNRLERQIHDLDHEDIFFDVDLEDASGEILRLRTLIRTLEQDIDIEVDTAGAHAQLAALQAHILSLRGGGGGGGGKVSSSLFDFASMLNPIGLATMAVKLAALLTILPAIASVTQVAVGALGTLGVALGVVGGGALSLVSALGVAAVGLGGFALTAIPAITKLYDENAKLTAQQKYLKGGIDMMRGSWQELQKSLEYVTFQSIESGLHAMIAGMRVMEPIMYNANKAVGGLFVNLENAIRGEQMTTFFEYLERAVGPLTTNIGNGLGNAARGIANLMVALEPLTSWMGQGFENMMERFSNWTFDLQGSEKMTAFIDYVKVNLPTIGDIFRDAKNGIVGFFAGFDTTAQDGLKWMAEKMKDFATWSSQLDENQGFQNMLTRIKEDGPEVAKAIGNMAEHITKMVGAISDSGVFETFNKIMDKDIFNFDKIGELFSPKNLLDPMGTIGKLFEAINWGNIFGGNKPQVELDVTANTDAVREHLMSLSKTDVIDLAVEADVGMAEAEIGRLTKQEIVDLIVNADTAQVEQQLTTLETERIIEALVSGDTTELINQINAVTNADNSVDVKVDADIAQAQATISQMPDAEIKATVSNVDTTRLGPVKLPIDLTGANGLSGFKWPPIPTFTWPSLPTFNWPPMPTFAWPALPKWTWPAMPKFSWPAYPKFTWPPMPTVRVSVSGGATDAPGFSSGLGRVSVPEANVNVHKDEAILQDHNAQFLRDIGVLKGDGRNPTLDTNAMASYGANTAQVSTATTTTTSNRSSSSVSVGDVHITVQGGNTNEETASAVQTALSQWFNTLSDIFPEVVEG